MQKKIFNIIMLFTFLTAISSCEKYLDEKTSNAIATPTTLYDLQALLDNSDKINSRVTPSLAESSGDDYFLKDETVLALPSYYPKVYTWTPFEYYYTGGNDWAKAYLPVYISNLCIERLETIVRTDQNATAWDNVKGTALFDRSYFFLHLAWEYSKSFDQSTANNDLGIALRENSDFNIASIRANNQDTYEKILTDVKVAALNLPDIQLQTIRPSKASAYALLARTYLSMRQYDSAQKYSNLSLAIKSDLLNYSIDVTVSGNASPFTQKYNNKEILFYSEMNNILPDHAPTRALIDSNLYDSYSNDDLRKKCFFTTSNGYHKFRGSYASSTSIFFTGITTAEMFLVRAECFARSGNITNALIDLNTLLVNRWSNNGTWVPVTATTSEDALAKILIERRKELIFRGIRWSDIKRLNKEGANIIPTRKINNQLYTLQPNSNWYALPIPTDIVNTTGMPQNPL